MPALPHTGTGQVAGQSTRVPQVAPRVSNAQISKVARESRDRAEGLSLCKQIRPRRPPTSCNGGDDGRPVLRANHMTKWASELIDPALRARYRPRAVQSASGHRSLILQSEKATPHVVRGEPSMTRNTLSTTHSLTFKLLSSASPLAATLGPETRVLHQSKTARSYPDLCAVNVF
jgi:hypothetical protein